MVQGERATKLLFLIFDAELENFVFRTDPLVSSLNLFTFWIFCVFLSVVLTKFLIYDIEAMIISFLFSFSGSNDSRYGLRLL